MLQHALLPCFLHLNFLLEIGHMPGNISSTTGDNERTTWLHIQRSHIMVCSALGASRLYGRKIDRPHYHLILLRAPSDRFQLLISIPSDKSHHVLDPVCSRISLPSEAQLWAHIHGSALHLLASLPSHRDHGRQSSLHREDAPCSSAAGRLAASHGDHQAVSLGLLHHVTTGL